MLTGRSALALLNMLAVISLNGCRTQPVETVVPPEQLGVACLRTELHFPRPDGADDASWDRFLAEIVTPRFPEPFTVLDGAGASKTDLSGRVMREQWKILILIHQTDPATHKEIEDIIQEYTRRFNGARVLRVTTPARVRS